MAFYLCGLSSRSLGKWLASLLPLAYWQLSRVDSHLYSRIVMLDAPSRSQSTASKNGMLPKLMRRITANGRRNQEQGAGFEITEYIKVNSKRFWTIFEAGARNLYFVPTVAASTSGLGVRVDAGRQSRSAISRSNAD